MKAIKISGEDRGEIVIYALSTCGWCKKTKQFLKEKGIAYSFLDVDLLDSDENKTAMAEVKKWNPAGSFPTIVINNQKGLRGFNAADLMKALEPNE